MASRRAHAVRFPRPGGPEVLTWTEVEVGSPGPGEVVVRHAAVGLNFVDTYFRSGLYPARLPSGLGSEAADVVEEVGDGVDHGSVGHRVAYATGVLVANADVLALPAEHHAYVTAKVAVPTADALLPKGLTAPK